MHIAQTDLIPVLMKFNPWWQGQSFSLPRWHRATFRELHKWVLQPPAPRAIFLSGARQVGKTTLLLQLIQRMIEQEGVPAASILYVTMDHPLLKLAGLERVVQTWKELDPTDFPLRWLFIDEIQYVKDWDAWVKLSVDFSKENRIIFTGSALPISNVSSESGVGRWHICRIGTLSFYEYIKIKNIDLKSLTTISSLTDLFELSSVELIKIATVSESYKGYFYEYLLRGGFPQTALVNKIDEAQKLIREDIVDKIIKRDMTAFFGVRHIIDLESIFLYLCMHDGSILEMKTLCENLEIKRPTAQSYIEILESAHLLTRIELFGYGKDILRGKVKVYLNDPSLSPAILLKGKELLCDQYLLGQCVESAVFKHLVQQKYTQNILFNYWKNAKKQEVDFIVTTGKECIPIEVKYREHHTEKTDFPGLLDFFKEKGGSRGYIITKNSSDCGLVPWGNIMKIPAHLFCWWMGEKEGDIKL